MGKLSPEQLEEFMNELDRMDEEDEKKAADEAMRARQVQEAQADAQRLTDPTTSQQVESGARAFASGVPFIPLQAGLGAAAHQAKAKREEESPFLGTVAGLAEDWARFSPAAPVMQLMDVAREPQAFVRGVENFNRQQERSQEMPHGGMSELASLLPYTPSIGLGGLTGKGVTDVLSKLPLLGRLANLGTRAQGAVGGAAVNAPLSGGDAAVKGGSPEDVAIATALGLGLGGLGGAAAGGPKTPPKAPPPDAEPMIPRSERMRGAAAELPFIGKFVKAADKLRGVQTPMQAGARVEPELPITRATHGPKADKQPFMTLDDLRSEGETSYAGPGMETTPIEFPVADDMIVGEHMDVPEPASRAQLPAPPIESLQRQPRPQPPPRQPQVPDEVLDPSLSEGSPVSVDELTGEYAESRIDPNSLWPEKPGPTVDPPSRDFEPPRSGFDTSSDDASVAGRPSNIGQPGARERQRRMEYNMARKAQQADMNSAIMTGQGDEIGVPPIDDRRLPSKLKVPLDVDEGGWGNAPEPEPPGPGPTAAAQEAADRARPRSPLPIQRKMAREAEIDDALYRAFDDEPAEFFDLNKLADEERALRQQMTPSDISMERKELKAKGRPTRSTEMREDFKRAIAPSEERSVLPLPELSQELSSEFGKGGSRPTKVAQTKRGQPPVGPDPRVKGPSASDPYWRRRILARFRKLGWNPKNLPDENLPDKEFVDELIQRHENTYGYDPNPADPQRHQEIVDILDELERMREGDIRPSDGGRLLQDPIFENVPDDVKDAWSKAFDDGDSDIIEEYLNTKEDAVMHGKDPANTAFTPEEQEIWDGIQRARKALPRRTSRQVADLSEAPMNPDDTGKGDYGDFPPDAIRDGEGWAVLKGRVGAAHVINMVTGEAVPVTVLDVVPISENSAKVYVTVRREDTGQIWTFANYGHMWGGNTQMRRVIRKRRNKQAKNPTPRDQQSEYQRRHGRWSGDEYDWMWDIDPTDINR